MAVEKSNLLDSISQFNDIAKSIIELRSKQEQLSNTIVDELQKDENSFLLSKILTRLSATNTALGNHDQIPPSENENNSVAASVVSVTAPAPAIKVNTTAIPQSNLENITEFYVNTTRFGSVSLASLLKKVLRNKPLGISAICKEFAGRKWTFNFGKYHSMEEYLAAFFRQSKEFESYLHSYKHITIYKIAGEPKAPIRRRIVNKSATAAIASSNMHPANDLVFDKVASIIKETNEPFILETIGNKIGIAPKLLATTIRQCRKLGLVKKVGVQKSTRNNHVRITVWQKC